jgi:hypothetical protein
LSLESAQELGAQISLLTAFLLAPKTMACLSRENGRNRKSGGNMKGAILAVFEQAQEDQWEIWLFTHPSNPEPGWKNRGPIPHG